MKAPFYPLLLALLALLYVQIQAQDNTLQMDIAIDVDQYGEGSIQISMRLSAQQWAMWKQMVGDRPSVLWRDLRHQFARHALESFDLTKNDVERTAVIRLGMRGGALIRSDGSRFIDVPREMKLISGQERNWIFSSVSQETPFSPVVSQTIRITLPKEAGNVRMVGTGTVHQGIVYTIAETRGFRPWLPWTGGALLLFGLVAGLAGFLPRRSGL